MGSATDSQTNIVKQHNIVCNDGTMNEDSSFDTRDKHSNVLFLCSVFEKKSKPFQTVQNGSDF